MTAPPEICLVGTGAIARDHMEAFDGLGVTGRRWAVSRRREAAEEFARKWGFEHWGTDPNEAFADPRVALAVIASPSEVHAGQAAAALHAGKDVVLEIPAGLNLADVEALAGLADEQSRRLFVCHTMRSFPAIREVKRRVERGAIDVAQVTGFFAIPRRDNQGWTGTRSWIDDLLWHHACHQVDATLWVLGVDGIGVGRGLFGRRHEELGMVMDLSLSFTCGDEVVVAHSLSYNSDRLLWELRFTGRRDVVVFRDGALLDEAGSEVIGHHSIRDLTVQNGEILDALATGRPSTFDIGSVMPAYRVLDQIDRSAKSGR